MWYIYERRKMKYLLFIALLTVSPVYSKIIPATDTSLTKDPNDDFDNTIIDFDEDYSLKFDKNHETNPWNTKSHDKFNKESHRYTVVKDLNNKVDVKENKTNISEITTARVNKRPEDIIKEVTPTPDYSVLPIELLSTTESILISLTDSTTEPDLTVIPLSTTHRAPPYIEIKQTVILPSTQSSESSTEYFTSTEDGDKASTVGENHEATTTKREITISNLETTDVTTENIIRATHLNNATTESVVTTTTSKPIDSTTSDNNATEVQNENLSTDKTTTTTVVTENPPKAANNDSITEFNETIVNTTSPAPKIENSTLFDELLTTNTSEQITTIKKADFDSSESVEDIPIFTGLDSDEISEVPEDYYDGKDVVPTTAPKTDALSVIFGLAGSVVESMVESVAERVVPKGIFDLFKRMQRQSEALEAERLRSREENGGLGQFTRGILKSISTGLSRPLSQLMAGAKDNGSLDTDRGFVNSLATGVSSVASSVVDSFKDRVQAIYPGTVWCGDGHSATARSGDLGLFFFTDTCCRQHDACKLYIASGDTKYGLTNTGLFTRSHCSCDTQFRDCLRKTNSLVSAQIGLTYFNVLGPQCFRKAHPIIKCARKTRITGQKCEEYELDYSKPKMWQWFDNETY